MTTSFPTFLRLPAATLDDLPDTPLVVLGAAEATPYDPARRSHSADAPSVIRAASQQFAGQVFQHDFDLGATLLAKDERRSTIGVDVGDVITKVQDAAGNRHRIAAAVEQVLAAGALPIVLGGDDSVPIPVIAAYDSFGPVTVVQIDAHVDWGDTIQGEDNGYGSPMRRVSEMPWVTGMVQVGIRGLGSGEAWQHDDAREFGDQIVTAREWHRRGVDGVLAERPAGERYVISIDCDGIDPAVFPAVAMPTPGGLTYEDCLDLLHGLAARGTIVGLILAEYVPDRDDPHRLCAQIAARLVTVALGLMRR
ncbi:arginase family protein [Sphingomonas sp. Mn802worker]|uniref:arginase family protein n=1 Tax=Sphingomonas sp. Mn802worker TaxID=629773 RepID=UPI00037DDF81|nr:arginase family protein [Sphingomonas sp. Mn802worker]